MSSILAANASMRASLQRDRRTSIRGHYPPSSSAGVRAHPHIHLEKPDFGIADIRCMMFAIYAANLARSGAGLSYPRQMTTIETYFATTANARAKSRTRVPSPCQAQAAATTTRATERAVLQQQGGRRQRGRQRRGKTSRHPPSNGGWWFSYHNTTNHSDADCRAIKNANIKNENGNAHVAAAQHTRMQGICSARDIPDPKEDSERLFISFSTTEVTSSAATTTFNKKKVRGRLARHRRHALGRLPSVKSRSSTSEGSPNTIRHTCSTLTAKGSRSTVQP